jgi:hypothetical protein
MEAPSPTYILTRAIYLIVALIAVLFVYGLVKKKQRLSAISTELQSITCDSSFFKQFSADDTRKTLMRAVALIMEANSLGQAPDIAIDRGLGIKEKLFNTDSDKKEIPAREKIIRDCLRTNYENCLRLGYTGDVRTIKSLKEGEFPTITSGPHSGKKPTIATLISPSISAGMEKVVANIEIRPPQEEGHKLTDIEVAAAKQLAKDLADAKIIEEPVRNRIIEELSKP